MFYTPMEFRKTNTSISSLINLPENMGERYGPSVYFANPFVGLPTTIKSPHHNWLVEQPPYKLYCVEIPDDDTPYAAEQMLVEYLFELGFIDPVDLSKNKPKNF